MHVGSGRHKWEVRPVAPVVFDEACSEGEDTVFVDTTRYWHHSPQGPPQKCMVEVDMRKKTLLSVVSCTGSVHDRGYHFPVKLHY
jgi:hypothetical protein